MLLPSITETKILVSLANIFLTIKTHRVSLQLIEELNSHKIVAQNVTK